jgi:muconolactone delta-isomerase
MSKFLVIERMAAAAPMTSPGSQEAANMLTLLRSDLEYKVRLQKEGKIVGGGPFLDVGAVCYILDVPTVEEMGEILFSSPLNPWTSREVHPLGTFADTLEGFKEMAGNH